LADPPRAPSAAGAISPLAGYTVAVASDRRRHGLAGLLESVGARTVGIQAARSVAKPDEAALRRATDRCLAAPFDELVVSSPLGLRAWLAAVRRWRLVQPLVARLGQARLLARDPSAADALRVLGLTTIFSTAGETTEELLRYLQAAGGWAPGAARHPLAGRRIVVQTDRLALAEPCRALRAAGAEVIEVPTHVAAPPAESYSLRRLCDLVIRRHVDGLALLGPAAAEQLRTHAAREGRLAPLLAALRGDVLCAALGPLSAAPLAEVTPLVAEKPYAEELAEAILTTLPRRGLVLSLGAHQLELRGQAVVLDGRFIAVQGGPLAVLRALARHPGEVLTAAEIRGSEPTWGDVDDHAVEMAVSRLRQALRGTDLVQTIVKRGYRLATPSV
jgi:uroporphyrinogen-III synthase